MEPGHTVWTQSIEGVRTFTLQVRHVLFFRKRVLYPNFTQGFQGSRRLYHRDN